MKRLVVAAALAAALFLLVLHVGVPGGGLSDAAAQTAVSAPVVPEGTRPSGFYDGEPGLSPSERAGREIWYKATAGNARFHTYVFQQRVGVLIDWYRVLNASDRGDRFRAWGMINDPDCCVPGSDGCPAKSLDETYGFEWCPGDETLLKFVGKPGYRDPACDFKDAAAGRVRRAPQGRRTSARLRATSSSAPPPARWASANSRTRASTASAG